MRRILNATDRDFPNARLTWLAGSIAPFESGWLVFARVMAINCLAWEELRRLLSLSEVGRARSADDLLCGYWVSFHVYSSLLGEPRFVLQRGFLDALGFPSSGKNTMGIRHCPECMRAGYHCSLFAIGALTHCPWHRVALTRGCTRCAMAVRNMDPRNASEGVVCPVCGTRIIDATRRVTSRVDPELCREAEESCKQIVAWWRAVREREPCANDLLGDALSAVARDRHVRLKWGSVQALVSLPRCWQSSPVETTPAMIVRWPTPTDACVLDDETWEKLAIRHYRSVRRKIFRRFIRRHRRCLSILASAERSDFSCLDREYACAVCIAYITWRRAVEQDGAEIERELKLLRLIDSDYPRTAVSEARLIDPPRSFSDHWPASGDAHRDGSVERWTLRPLSLRGMIPPPDLVPRLLYAEFLRLWMELEVGHIEENVKVVINPLTSGELQLPSAITSTRADQRSSAPGRGFSVLLPDARSLLDHANARCSHRRSVGGSMFDAHAQFNADTFPWQDREIPHPLFKLRYGHGSGSRFENVIPFPSMIG
ncbi:hypothetical protein BN2476_680153 [Paraburkholderia piptadeniae]|uniref:TniQ protein n=1 Tax=Paraburkholderia piptadeniae TaxID=1701573 RepID=A0A1N7SRA7_9BURK|nr:hypothetical protein [Paraburkholderia piptadeniae]SIT49457.1 hypothetical protein BN2476_680153 [Paraburkholderia piptadeniae]